MFIEIDFESEEAFYMQLRNQVIMGIATRQLQEGDVLPSVRSMADLIGINMHTVNKAYALLKQEGFLQLDRRRGAVIAIDMNHLAALGSVKADLGILLAQAACKGVTAEEIHQLVDEIYGGY